MKLTEINVSKYNNSKEPMPYIKTTFLLGPYAELEQSDLEISKATALDSPNVLTLLTLLL